MDNAALLTRKRSGETVDWQRLEGDERVTPHICIVYRSCGWCAARAVAKGASAASNESTTVIASPGRWDIDPSEVGCLSLNRKIPNRIFGKDYSDNPRILTLLQLNLPNARVSANDPKCQYVLTFNVNTDHLGAARLFGRTAKILASIVITQAPIPQEQQISSYKNIYVFRDDLTPIQSLRSGSGRF